MIKLNRKSFAFRLIMAFLLISIVPIVFLSVSAYRNTAKIVEKNMDELTRINLSQTAQSIKTVIASYEDLAYQIYTNESAAELAVRIDNNDNIEVSRNQLSRLLRGYAYVKPYVESISVITKEGEVICYDMITATSTKTSWLDNFELSRQELYRRVSEEQRTGILTSQYATAMGGKDYYLFHLTHRIVDYRNINQKEAVLIFSIDEQLLDATCNQEMIKNGIPNCVIFIIDKQGRLVSFSEPSLLGKKVVDLDQSPERQADTYEKLVRDTKVLPGKYVSTHTLYDEKLGWTFVTVSDHSSVIASIKSQQKTAILTAAVSFLALVILALAITNYLTRSIGKVVKAMKVVEQGKLSVQVETDKNMPLEVTAIANQFNHMIQWLKESMEKEKEANIKQRNAEIAALEAQINPHFLYNTLDTINWMAIDNNQYEISNTINSLAHILRYSIDKSNSTVALSRELEWLKQYVFLQQTRMKNAFECSVHADPDLLHAPIHKLLFQPFVENALLHGFEGVRQKNILDIKISSEEDKIKIVIEDNGKGMPKKLVEELNRGMTMEEADKSHIGIKNAVERLSMYYGAACSFWVESELKMGTKITIIIPKAELMG
jgi:two-component system sensor histidine kinase YesM